MLPLVYEFYSPDGVKKNKNVSHSSMLVLDEANKFGVDWEIIPCTQLIKLTYKGKVQTYYHQVPSSTTALAKYACNNKKVTTNLLLNSGVSVPKGFRIKKNGDEEYLKSAYKNLKKPVVVKPSNGALGTGITVNINSIKGYKVALKEALAYSGQQNQVAIVEEMFDGTEYRILATKDKVIGVVYRRPASVLGNGKDTIKKLIKEKNKELIRSGKKGTVSHLKIRMDSKMLKLLDESNKDFDFIVPKDERVYLRKVSNISQGGDAIDFTDKVHPSVKDIALKAINAIPGLSFAGIDFLTMDITKKQNKESYTIIEINDSPGFDIHDFPYEGKNRHAAREFLFLMFPELKKIKI